MKKILIGFIMDGNAGGIDKYLLNFLKTVHMKNVQIDFLTNSIDLKLQEKLKEYHSSLYEIANLKHPLTQYRQVRKIIRENGYDTVYFNISTAIDCIAAIAAKHEGVKRRLIHSHSSGNDCENVWKRTIFNMIHDFCRCFLYRYATEYYGCSEKAGLWLFPKKIVNSDRFDVIYNAVDRKRFSYQPEIREEVRETLDLKGRFVVGHVGNFCYQKNHTFLLQVFAEVVKKEPKAVLLLAGDGPSFNRMKEFAGELGIKSQILFLGRRTDADRLYQAMDVFVLPSNFEGLPIAGIEAQSSGLPCIMSSTITRESRITKQCEFLSFQEGMEHWANVILKQRKKRKAAEFLPTAENYDLAKQEEQLRRLI